MIYENKEDRKKQSKAVAILQSKMPHRKLVETKEVFRINYDFTILNSDGLKVGVGEVKCRNYNAAFFKTHPWMFEVDRIESLYDNCMSKGFKVMLVLYTKDGVVFWVDMKDVLDWQSFEAAPDYMLTDNHGKKQADKRGILIPPEMLNEVITGDK